MGELRVTHNMNIEDTLWNMDDRLDRSTATKLIGFRKFFETQESNLSSSLSRRQSFMGESSFKDFRDYCKGTVENFSVANIIQNMDKLSHFGSIQEIIRHNVNECRGEGRKTVR